MIYVYAPNQTLVTFPYSISDLQRDNINTSFPRNPTEETLAAYDVFPVVEQLPPDYNPAIQNLKQTDPILVNGQWLQTWEVSDASVEEIASRIRANADYLGFWGELIMSSVYTSIREQSMVSLPMNTLATEFIALIGDAKAGRPNEPAIQQSINAILATGTFTETHLSELQAVLDTSRINTIYVLPGISTG